MKLINKNMLKVKDKLKCISGCLENGFKVSNDGFLVYFNGLRNEPMFDQKLKFELHLVKLNCNDGWVEDTLLKACELLKNTNLPPHQKACNTCNYLKDRWKVKAQID